MKRHLLFGALALATGVLLSGCYPKGPEYIEEYDLVYTDYSPDYDFKARHTYALPDSVVQLTGNLIEGERPDMLSPVYANEILGKIKDNMNKNGWTEVEIGQDPDVLVLPSTVSTTTVNVWYDYYWGWYYPYYGYGWYYPGYYPPTVSSYTTGSVLIQMVDPGDISGTEKMGVEWLCIVNGLMEGSTSGLITRIDKSIDQAFTQSPYLKH